MRKGQQPVCQFHQFGLEYGPTFADASTSLSMFFRIFYQEVLDFEDGYRHCAAIITAAETQKYWKPMMAVEDMLHGHNHRHGLIF